MKNKSIVSILIIAIIALAGYFLWNNTKDNTPQNDEIKIGVILPLTGPVAEPGSNVLKGIQIAIDDFNRQPNNNNIELIVEDSKSNPKDGVSAVKKIIEIDKAKIIIGDIMSSVFLAMAPVAEEAKVVLISPGASNPAVRDAGDYIFRDYTSDNYDGEIMANYIFKNLGKKIAAVVYVNNDYGIGVANAFKTSFEKSGGMVSLEAGYSEGQSEFKTIAAKVIQSKPECVYMVGNPAENGHLVKELKIQNAHITLTGNLSFENELFYKVANQSFDSVIYSAPYFDISKDDPYTKLLIETYQQKYSKLPSVEAALGYDVAGILMKALKSVNYNQAELKSALYKIQNYDGITGQTSFDEFGDVKKSILIKILKNDGTTKILSNYFPGE